MNHTEVKNMSQKRGRGRPRKEQCKKRVRETIQSVNSTAPGLYLSHNQIEAH